MCSHYSFLFLAGHTRFTPEVVNFLQTLGPRLSRIPTEWPDYLKWAMANVPRAWSLENNETTRSQSVMGNLYSALTRTYQMAVILEQVTTQMSVEL